VAPVTYDASSEASHKIGSLDDIQDILRIKLLGVIPESEAVLQASSQGVPTVNVEATFPPRIDPLKAS
jgi:septum site-determining protein MinD